MQCYHMPSSARLLMLAVCVGFAMMEAMLVTAAALQKFTFQPPPGESKIPQAQPRITLRPAAVKLLLQTRDRSC